MRLLSIVALLVVCAGSTTSLAEGRLAVVITAEAMGEDELYATESRVLRAIDELGGIETVAREETKIHVQAMSELQGGACDVAECLINVGAVAGAGSLLHVRLGDRRVVGELFELSRQEREAELSWPAPEGLTAPMAARLARSLLRPRAAGWLVFTGVPEGATVSLDEETLAEPRAEGVSPGPHRVAVAAVGYEPYSEVVEVEPGAVQTKTVALRPVEVTAREKGLAPMWLIPSLLLGGGGAGVVVGAGMWAATWMFPPPAPVDRDAAMARDGTLRAIGASAGAAGLALLTGGAAWLALSSTEAGPGTE